MVKYKIEFIYNGVVQVKYFNTPQQAAYYKYRILNSLGESLEYISNVIESP